MGGQSDQGELWDIGFQAEQQEEDQEEPLDELEEESSEPEGAFGEGDGAGEVLAEPSFAEEHEFSSHSD